MKESRVLEFKQNITNSFLKTVSAYANYGDGKILFGVDDEGNEIGMDQPERQKLDIENKINDSIDPRPDFSLQVNPRTRVIVLTVFEGPDKPYLYRGTAYRRSDMATAAVDRVELNRLTLRGTGRTFDQLRSSRQDLSFASLEKELIRKTGISRFSTDVLKTLDLFSEKDGYNNAAALLADVNDFPGTDIIRFGGSVSEIRSRTQLQKMSVLEQYARAVDEYRKYYRYEVIDGVARSEREDIPEQAFREAAANALIHRTWDVRAQIGIAMYDDRVEITSPGGLPFGISEEEYLRGYVSVLRNPILANVFFRLHYVEIFGTGVRRILDAYSRYQVKPEFEISENAVRVILPSVARSVPFTPDESKVLAVFAGGQMLSSTEAASLSGFTKSKTLRLLKSLEEKKAIVKTGRGRGTLYHSRQGRPASFR